MREVLLFFDRPAEHVIEEAASCLEQRQLSITHRTPFSVAFADQERTVGQFAAVPVQLRPEWCRVWLTIEGSGATSSAADAYVAEHRDASQRTEAEVKQLETSVYAEDRWPAYEARLRTSLVSQGNDDAAVDAKVAAFKQRWLALARKTALTPPQEPDTA
jgi:hypothetical protein